MLGPALVSDDLILAAHNPKTGLASTLIRIDMEFLAALIWSVGAVLDGPSQSLFTNHLRDFIRHVHDNNGRTFKIEASCMIPESRGCLASDFYHEAQRWWNWKERLQDAECQPSQEHLMIETTETLKTKYFLRTSAACRLPVLLIGPTGTGKTAVTRSFLQALPRSKHLNIEMTFSARTTAEQLAEGIAQPLEKRGRHKIGPSIGKRCNVFIDDLSMPTPGKYGAQAANELLRQLIDHHQHYEHSEKGRPLVHLVDIDYVAAMPPPSGGRSPVSARLLRHFNV
jgi:dynein heavy chain, axonemal